VEGISDVEDTRKIQPFCVRHDSGRLDVCGGISDRKHAVRCGGDVCITLGALVSFFVGCDVAGRRPRSAPHPLARQPNHTLNAGRVDRAEGGNARV
jgi:hypothetical protein